MKTILSRLTGVASFVIMLVAMQTATAQAPQKMSYQAVVRNSNNELVTSKSVGMRISILQGSATGAPVYVETQTPATNANGLASLEIGGGTVVTGTVAGINWAAGSFFIKTETDPTGGTNYTIAGASQLLSVPYALFSASGNPGPVGPAGVQGPQGIAGPPGSSNGWGIAGNAGSNPATNFIGTSDDNDIIIKRNNVRAGLLASLNTSFGVGALNPVGTGTGNTANGTGTLATNTTGNNNTANGRTALFYNTNGFANSAFGVQSLYSNTTGNQNTAIGVSALNFNTSGNSNTAIGVSALENNTTGPNNTASGKDALSANTTGSNNVANGYQALYSNVSGSYNTATGIASLYFNTLGSFNTATGSGALYTNTTGNSNTASGVDALRLNTTGFDNVATGQDALRSNSTGSSNTANGRQALNFNTTGINNTAMGSGALRLNTTGGSNTAVGFALLNNTTGSYNIAVGYSLITNTTGSYNTAIGDGANVSTGNLTNATAIGANAFVNASNKVRIGSTAVTVVEVPVAVTVSSDGRLKDNIIDTELGLDFILRIRPVQYTMKQGNGKTDYGFIAQELKIVLGDRNVNMLNKDGEFYTVRYNDLLSPMVKAMQEQQAIIENLKSEVELLKAQHLSGVGRLEMENSLLKSDYNNRLKKLEEMLSVKAQK